MPIKSNLSDVFKGYFAAKNQEQQESYLRQIYLLINNGYFLDEKYLNSYIKVKNRDERLQEEHPVDGTIWGKEENAKTVSTSSEREVITPDRMLQATKELVDAVQARDLNKTKEAIKKGAMVNILLDDKQSLLEKAALTNSKIACELLNDPNITINVEEKGPNTPTFTSLLHRAFLAKIDNCDFINALLNKGA